MWLKRARASIPPADDPPREVPAATSYMIVAAPFVRWMTAVTLTLAAVALAWGGQGLTTLWGGKTPSVSGEGDGWQNATPILKL